ncbi:hypothetical protein [Promicromonospora sp. NPDC050880]|uniref:hypothetical protein n=1 Tax=Promicromonospora sp. NPDC050880 TaxID=3364406 RepID=UPI003799F285
MASDLTPFFTTTAQVIPALLIVIGLDAGLLRTLRTEGWRRAQTLDRHHQTRAKEELGQLAAAPLEQDNVADIRRLIAGHKRTYRWRVAPMKHLASVWVAALLLLTCTAEIVSLIATVILPQGAWRVCAVSLVGLAVALLLGHVATAVVRAAWHWQTPGGLRPAPTSRD